ncbi:Ferric iron reductase protein FhuF, involved in iron transport [Fontibacillus panacisegetis]|uniref:Ferric iron reductase protein FhuF, involved in iron transport n=1 Tax=Fontibacillus panacisegetis TaxID=670482 RepID=A0A1G7SPV5_9BACL|nr:IucA/IucC family C-terminal-domain containing protein [Fontibacillus panacisegetis]SDG25136.1 Ferric iron reductase protein FhuF, involved in iron transport [Fontibacillus panacisegetis]
MNDGITSLLDKREWEYLTQNLRLTTEVSSEREFSMASSDLLDEELCGNYLDRLTAVFESPSRRVTASMLAKRYAFMVVSPSLYAMSMFDKGLKLPLKDSHIESGFRNEAWLPSLRLSKMEFTEPADRDSYRHRELWRDVVVRSIFADHLAPLWGALSRAANIPKPILWENTAVYVYFLYETRIAGEAEGARKAVVEKDFDYLLNAPAELFGESRNPLSQFYSPKLVVEGSDKPVRMRKTCCQYYTTSKERHYCNSCPCKSSP